MSIRLALLVGGAAVEFGGLAIVRPVRLGAFPAALIGLVPTALRSLPAYLTVTVREATTSALTRALRAGTVDLAILAQSPPFRPLDAESPPLGGLPEGVRVVAVRSEPHELRRIVLARQPGPMEEPAPQVADALMASARGRRAGPGGTTR